MLVFRGEGKPEYPEKTSRCKENQQTQPTYDAGSGIRTRAIPVPQSVKYIFTTIATNPAI